MISKECLDRAKRIYANSGALDSLGEVLMEDYVAQLHNDRGTVSRNRETLGRLLDILQNNFQSSPDMALRLVKVREEIMGGRIEEALKTRVGLEDAALEYLANQIVECECGT